MKKPRPKRPPKTNRKSPKTLPKVRVSDIDQSTFSKEDLIPDPFWAELYTNPKSEQS